jgi:hypothetical protein
MFVHAMALPKISAMIRRSLTLTISPVHPIAVAWAGTPTEHSYMVLTAFSLAGSLTLIGIYLWRLLIDKGMQSIDPKLDPAQMVSNIFGIINGFSVTPLNHTDIDGQLKKRRERISERLAKSPEQKKLVMKLIQEKYPRASSRRSLLAKFAVKVVWRMIFRWYTDPIAPMPEVIGEALSKMRRMRERSHELPVSFPMPSAHFYSQAA